MAKDLSASVLHLKIVALRPAQFVCVKNQGNSNTAPNEWFLSLIKTGLNKIRMTIVEFNGEGTGILIKDQSAWS